MQIYEGNNTPPDIFQPILLCGRLYVASNLSKVVVKKALVFLTFSLYHGLACEKKPYKDSKEKMYFKVKSTGTVLQC